MKESEVEQINEPGVKQKKRDLINYSMNKNETKQTWVNLPNFMMDEASQGVEMWEKDPGWPQDLLQQPSASVTS